jgi:NADPH:quinone reductase-like Zn-dependent oxidoreductase
MQATAFPASMSTVAPNKVVLESVPLTEPEHGEVRVRVHAMGLNRADLMGRNQAAGKIVVTL